MHTRAQKKKHAVSELHTPSVINVAAHRHDGVSGGRAGDSSVRTGSIEEQESWVASGTRACAVAHDAMRRIRSSALLEIAGVHQSTVGREIVAKGYCRARLARPRGGRELTIRQVLPDRAIKVTIFAGTARGGIAVAWRCVVLARASVGARLTVEAVPDAAIAIHVVLPDGAVLRAHLAKVQEIVAAVTEGLTGSILVAEALVVNARATHALLVALHGASARVEKSCSSSRCGGRGKERVPRGNRRRCGRRRDRSGRRSDQVSWSGHWNNRCDSHGRKHEE